eukprot:scaffold28601_cov100-Skeletonema_dohrnii-CCMP3373.AAC.1
MIVGLIISFNDVFTSVALDITCSLWIHLASAFVLFGRSLKEFDTPPRQNIHDYDSQKFTITMTSSSEDRHLLLCSSKPANYLHNHPTALYL